MPVDAILSTAPPITSHVIARQAKEILKCPWIADFRDLWANNLDNPNGSFFGCRSYPGKEMVEYGGRSGHGFSSLGRPPARIFSREAGACHYQRLRSRRFCRQFRFDDRYFSISYTGQLYAGRRDPTALFEVVHELIVEGIIDRKQMRIRFYGPIEPWVEPLVERYDLKGVVEIHGSIDRSEALQRQQESQLLLLLGWANPQETGQHTGQAV